MKKELKVFSGYEGVPSDLKGANIALGAFDGLHLGHKTLLQIAKSKGDNKLGILLFEPPPKLFFASNTHGMRLATERITEVLAAQNNVDVIYSINFDAKFASLSAIEFIDEVLFKGFEPKNIVVGHDFRFGKARQGDIKLLSQKCQEKGVGLTIVDPVKDETGQRISSTRIREALQNGDTELANKLLGHPWIIEGVVEHGQKLGRELGFPTANIKLYEQIEPKFGIYAVRVDVGDKIWHIGAANFGRTPTTGIRDPLFEVHLLDYKGDLYGKNITIEMHHFLRPEVKYNSLDELKTQIIIDSDNTRKFFLDNGVI